MFFANFLTNLASIAGNAQSKACLFIIADEPKCPKSLIK
jgi:cyclic lactone autoinducer peptide